MAVDDLLRQLGQVRAVEKIGVASGGPASLDVAVAVADHHRCRQIDTPFGSQLQQHPWGWLSTVAWSSHGGCWRVGVMRAMCDIRDMASGAACLCPQMVVEDMHLLDGIKFASDASLICHDETGNAVPMEQRQRGRRAWHPGKIIHKMGIAMVDIQRLVAVEEYRAAKGWRLHVGIFLW